MEAWKEVLRHIVVPRGALLIDGEALLPPLRRESAMDDVNNLNKEGRSASSGVENLDERLVWRDGSLFARLVR